MRVQYTPNPFRDCQSWHLAPYWAKFRAMDGNGDYHWFEHKPLPNQVSKTWQATGRRVWAGKLDGEFSKWWLALQAKPYLSIK